MRESYDFMTVHIFPDSKRRDAAVRPGKDLRTIVGGPDNGGVIGDAKITAFTYT
jgi:hypothetical protein